MLSRKTDTEFNLRNGETIVLSGLLQRELSNDVDKVPLLGDLPVVGALFRSKRYQNKETELVVFVTPTIVSAQSDGVTDRVKRINERLEERLGAKPFVSEPVQPGVAYERPDGLAGQPVAGGHRPATVPAATLTPLPAAPSRAAARLPAGGSTLSVVAEGTALRAEPHAGAAVLLHLDAGAVVLLGAADLQPPGSHAWRNVVVGGLDGWVPAESVQPRGKSAERTPSAAAARDAQSGRPVRPSATATATAGGTPAPRALTPVAASTAGARQFRVGIDGLALRTLPDLNAEVVANLIAGDTVAALPQPPQGAWTAVQFGDAAGGKRGWVATQWLVPAEVQ